jgi:hypothetical protein
LCLFLFTSMRDPLATLVFIRLIGDYGACALLVRRKSLLKLLIWVISVDLAVNCTVSICRSFLSRINSILTMAMPLCLGGEHLMPSNVPKTIEYP